MSLGKVVIGIAVVLLICSMWSSTTEGARGSKSPAPPAWMWSPRVENLAMPTGVNRAKMIALFGKPFEHLLPNGTPSGLSGLRENLMPNGEPSNLSALSLYNKPIARREHMYAANWVGAPGADSVTTAAPQLVVMPEAHAIKVMPIYGEKPKVLISPYSGKLSQGELFTVINPPILGSTEHYEIFP